MQRSIISASGILVLGLIVLLLNGLGDAVLGRFYIDLTEERLYTLSQGSKNILAKLDSPVTVRAYLSKTDSTKYPAIKLYADRVVSLLKEYQRVSGGKVHLELYDPRPDTDEESWAQKYGITPLAMPGGERIFFGMAAVNARGEEEVIPVFSLSRQEFLEYDVTKAINSLSLATKPVVGVISSLKLNGGAPQQSQMFGQQPPPSNPWVVMNQMSQFAEVRMLQADVGKIDPAIKVLMLIHPKGLSPDTLYAIDQFVLGGGNLFVAIDPYSGAEPNDPANAQDPMAAMSQTKSSNLKELLGGWGVEMDDKAVVGDINLATKVNTGQGAEPQDFVFWLSLDGKGNEGQSTINKTDILTSQLENVMFAWAGALKNKPLDGVTFEPLFQTTKEATTFGEADYRMGGGSPTALLNKYLNGSESLVIAARISGKLKSNFQGKPSGAPEGTPAEPHLGESTDKSYVVVVADTDFLTDQSSVVVQNVLGMRMVTAINDNLAFAGNLTENLLGSSDLISLRSRGQFTRPFTRVKEIERQAEAKWRMEEVTLQAQLNAANQRMNQIQAGSERAGSGEQVFSKALLDEMKKFRDQRAEAESRLREVRRNLRQDKERLGQWLFLLNTFAVPFAIILVVLIGCRNKAARRA